MKNPLTDALMKTKGINPHHQRRSIFRDIDTKKNVQYLWTKCLKSASKNYV